MKQLIREIFVIVTGIFLYLGLYLGADYYLGTQELLYDWQYHGKRELLTTLAWHIGMVSAAFLAAYLVCQLGYQLAAAGGRLSLIGVTIAVYFWLAQSLWLATFFFLALLCTLFLARGFKL